MFLSAQGRRSSGAARHGGQTAPSDHPADPRTYRVWYRDTGQEVWVCVSGCLPSQSPHTGTQTPRFGVAPAWECGGVGGQGLSGAQEAYSTRKAAGCNPSFNMGHV